MTMSITTFISVLKIQVGFGHDFIEQITAVGTKEKVPSCEDHRSCTLYFGGLGENLAIDFALAFSMK